MTSALTEQAFDQHPGCRDTEHPAGEDGSKQPEGATWERWQTQRPDDTQLAAWYAHDRTGIGYVCGQVSGGLLAP